MFEKMHKIDHIVFDIGQVLLHWDPHLVYADLIPDIVERTDFLETICNGPWNLEQDRGRSWQEAEDELIAVHPEKAHLIRAYRNDWIKCVPHAYEKTVASMLALIDQGRDVTLLTNFNQETFPLATAKYPFLTKPRGVTVSGEVKLIKPDSEIYELHAKTFDLVPERCLFIDDREMNVASAKACGWRAVHYTGHDKLRHDFAEFGIQV